MKTRIHLTPAQFSEQERLIVRYGNLSAAAFRFSTGVCGLRIKNKRGTLVMLPYQGQQVWSAEFGDLGMKRRNITMRSMFEEPRPTRDFLATFGGFIQHLGATATGSPGPGDSHPLHGELPNAPYQEAFLLTGEDKKGPYMEISGKYSHQSFFGPNYLAEPSVKLYDGDACFSVSMQITNSKKTDMELMYASHVNFNPVDHARLLYTARCTPEHVRVRKEIPSHIQVDEGYKDLIAILGKNPDIHHVLDPNLVFNPEVVFKIDYLADVDGWATSMQLHPDKSADYIRHRPDELPKGTRWISRTPDHDAIALVEPGTCEQDGYTAEKKKGNVLILGPGKQFSATFECGVLGPRKSKEMVAKIAKVLRDQESA